MHEYGIVQNLIDLCEENASKHRATRVLKATVELGSRSGVEAGLLQSAFEDFKRESAVCQDAELCIQIQPVVLSCESCQNAFEAEGLAYGICPKCGSSEVAITKGRELNLLRLEME